MCGQIRVALISVVGAALCLATWAPAQTVQVQVPAAAPAVVLSAAHLEQLAPSAPTVTYENGMLTISAYNSTLSDILRGIRSQTGADVDIPPEAEERVVTRSGPGLARDVLHSLLVGSRFNFIIVGSDSDPRALTRVLLFAKSAAENTPQSLVNNASAAQQPRVVHHGSNIEGVQQQDNLPVRAQQQMLQQRRQMIMEQRQQSQRPE